MTQGECRSVEEKREAVVGNRAGARRQRTGGIGTTGTAGKILVGYLALSSIAATIAFAHGRDSLILLVAHLAALAICAAVFFRLIPDSRALSLIPLVSFPFLYAELPHLLLSSQLHDDAVQAWEAFIFGASPAHSAAGHWPWLPLSELLHGAYLSYYAIIYVPPLYLYLRGDREQFERTVTALMAVFAICFVLFIVYPVAGPRYLWPAPAGIPDGPIRRLDLWLLASGSSKGAAFPSSHVAVSTTQTLMAWQWNRRAGAILGVLTVLLAAGAVYGGFHYAIDTIAGAAVGVAVVYGLRAIETRRIKVESLAAEYAEYAE